LAQFRRRIWPYRYLNQSPDLIFAEHCIGAISIWAATRSPGLRGFIIEVNGTDIIQNLPLARDLAKQGRFHKIAISIDDLGAEWSSLMGLREFPFVEIKVDGEFVSGCADDRLKKTMCRQIRELAENYGARTVAEGVDTRADFLAVRELGFDMVQGCLLGEPMRVQKFARTMMRQSVKMPEW
jgi:EAL domain-containing protein (putative c-di-GMP-specific phosphodiesterase class I)